MPAHSNNSTSNLEDWARREKIVEALEHAWLQGEEPRLEDFLPSEEPDRTPVLIDLVQADMECRIQAGHSARVEDYLERFPDLAKDKALLDGLRDWERKQGQRRPLDTPLDTPLEGDAPLFLTTGGRLDDVGKPANEQLLSTQLFETATPAPKTMAFGALPRIPGYDILEELGGGGMGVVYKARQTKLDRLVALKMIRPESNADEKFVARFLAEAEAVARLKHPNIVQIYESGAVDGAPFFSMEFVEGHSLDKQIKMSPLPVREAAKLVEVLARAINDAHLHGIVHRDLKPANVLLQIADARLLKERSKDNSAILNLQSAVAKIADFGLAKRLDVDSSQTRTGVIMGTPSYMAPEQAMGKVALIGPAADIYALGAVLYDALVGRPPFRGASGLETIQQLLDQEPIPPRQLQCNVPRDVETICLKCLQKDPKKRYVTAEALADDLRRYAAGESIAARPTPHWERAWKWTRRKPALAGLLGIAVLASLAIVAFLSVYALYASQQADIYKQKLARAKNDEEVRARGRLSLAQVEKHEAAEDWTAANTVLQKIQGTLEAQNDPGADELRAEVKRRLSVVQAKLRAQKRLQDFWLLYDNALFHETLPANLDKGEGRAAVREAARAALALYRLDVSASKSGELLGLLQSDRPHQGSAEHARLAAACYELLLVWAEAETISPQPEGAEQSRLRAERALTLLARAEQLGQVYHLQTRTFYLHRARYLASSKGEDFDSATAEKGAPPKPVGRLDWFLTALARTRQNNPLEAIAACERVLEIQGDDFWAVYVKALSLLRLGQWAAAKAELTVCLNRKREIAWPRLLRGFAASELGFKYKEEQRSLSRIHPRFRALAQLAADEFKTGEEDFNTALNQDHGSLTQYVGLVNRGVLFIREQRWPEAVADLEQAVLLSPNNYQGHLDLAQAFAGQGQKEKALAAMDQAVLKAPTLPEVYGSRARMLLLQKEPEKAQQDFKEAIALEPRGSKSERLGRNFVDLGKLLHRAGEYASALASYDQALAAFPEFVETQRFRAESLLALNRRDEAAAALDAYLSVVRPAPAEVYEARGILFAGKGQLSLAVEMYTLALKSNPKDHALATAIRCQRGWAYLLADAAFLALEDFEACLRSDQKNVDALIGRGNARVRLKLLDKALDDAQAAETQQGLTDRLSYHLARLYAQVVAVLEGDSRKSGTRLDPGVERRHTMCLEKALAALRQTLDKLPLERRAGFWHEQVQVDPAFYVLRRDRAYAQLDIQFRREE